MAYVQFYENLPSGTRLQDLFVPLDTPIAYDTGHSPQLATFGTIINRTAVQVTYRGPALASDHGDVWALGFESSGRPWIAYGSDSDPTVKFSYSGGLAAFHQSGAAAAAAAMAGDDILMGSSKGDFMDGYDGNDIFYGGAGEDTMTGGLGDDTFYVNTKEDRVFENPFQGHDTVITTVSYALAAGSEVEVLRSAGGTSNVSLNGNGFANLIVGNAGANTISGGGGVDTLDGGQGNDTYVVDNPLTQILEGPGGGVDTVLATVSYALQDSALVEFLAAKGSASISLTGNGLSNTITGNVGHNVLSGLGGNDKLYGDAGNDRLFGGIGKDQLFGGEGQDSLYGEDGNDQLYGDVGTDKLYGGTGNDKLYGGEGNDIMSGGMGSDILYGDVGDDTLKGDAGNDLLYGGPGNNKLYGGDGRDTLYGSYNDEILSGGNGNDLIFGDSGNDTVYGGLGNDTLSSGEGYDTFVFDTKPNGRSNVDTIWDFNPWTDRIVLKASAFRGIPKGELGENAFWIGAAAHAAADRIIYDKDAGTLYYDPDGTGAAHQVKFAVVGQVDLSHAAFLIV